MDGWSEPGGLRMNCI